MADIITGRNAVMEALKSNREIEKITVGKGTEGSIKKIVGMAKDKKIPIYYTEKSALDRIAGNSAHQGVAAQVSQYTYCQVEDILQRANSKGEEPFIIVLDGLEDPHNLGAIMRTAECCGAHGIVIPKRRSVGITETVVKASAGAVEYMLCAKVSNIAQTIDRLKEKGVWVAACHMEGQAYTKQDLKGSLALVIGGEGAGISRLAREKCDFQVSIPMKGKISSLNASNAAAILMYEVLRQREG
ncbi:MAG: 23S rRNA (guanosine(2251)-2'-O)-methyltransferase RlmB [Firmicutes bacterium]|nr:23S rRNA (guanosine(2251)-2'-O)-methyltransferase RlmB [Bacillota bacterium]NBI64642.1 23S rRNA (guanosine(2251)-2'-O)-methyltransferase RlmB [Clostridiales bacterium]